MMKVSVKCDHCGWSISGIELHTDGETVRGVATVYTVPNDLEAENAALRELAREAREFVEMAAAEGPCFDDEDQGQCIECGEIGHHPIHAPDCRLANWLNRAKEFDLSDFYRNQKEVK